MEKGESLLSPFSILLLYFLTAGAVKKWLSGPPRVPITCHFEWRVTFPEQSLSLSNLLPRFAADSGYGAGTTVVLPSPAARMIWRPSGE